MRIPYFDENISKNLFQFTPFQKYEKGTEANVCLHQNTNQLNESGIMLLYSENIPYVHPDCVVHVCQNVI